MAEQRAASAIELDELPATALASRKGSGSGRWWSGSAIAVIVIVGALLVLDPLSERETELGLPAELTGEPDLYMEDAVITRFRPDGTLEYSLASAQIRYFESQHLTRVLNPSLTLHNDGQPPWNVMSDQGYLHRRATPEGGTEEVVYLRSNVRLAQRFDDGRHVELKSAALYVYPDRQYAETDRDVMIDTDVGRTTAAGLHGDLKQGLYHLVSNAEQRVHTIVLPGQFR